MKKLVIVKPGCRDVGNELVNRMSIYAYGLETGALVVNRSPYEYPGPLKMLHALYARYVGLRHGKCSLHAWRAPIFLPPTKPLETARDCGTLYFFGWVFRNPIGLEKYRNVLLEKFALGPIERRQDQIGIHIRQQPFPGFPGGDFLVSITRVRQIVDEYVQERRLRAEDVVLLVASDLPVPAQSFAGYKHRVIYGNTETNLFSLANSSAIIGTNTTFANTAAWFANIPHVVTTNEPIDWVYYRDKKEYFDNTYATFAY